MEYTILTSDEPDKLTVYVNLALEQGWELVGGVSAALSESDEYRYIVFAQAMIRREAVGTRERMPAHFAEELRKAAIFTF